MSVGDFAKDKAKGAVNAVKNKIVKVIMPYALGALGIILLIGMLYLVINAVIITVVGASSSYSTSVGSASSGMPLSASTPSGSSWEQYKKYVLTMEGGTRVNAEGIVDENGEFYIVEDDWYGNPTVGHGLCLESKGSYMHVDEFKPYGIDTKDLVKKYYEAVSAGYNSKKDAHSKYFPRVSVQICDEIWDTHLRAKYESRVSLYKHLNLKEYQYYALTDVSYRRGNTDGFETAYKNKWKASDDQYHKDTSSEPFSMDSLYSFFNDGWTDTESGVYTRKQNQWLLFKYGYYRPLKEYAIVSTGGVSGKATGFWWPIEPGSDGKTPLSTAITSGREFKSSHLGIDINRGGRSESPKIIASYDGVVDTVVNYSGQASSPNYGTYVIIKHNYKGETYYTYYPHMVYQSIPSNIKVGEPVSAGTVLGTMGETGYSFGIHLHFEIRKGSKNPRSSVAVNPLEYVDPSHPYPTD